MDRRIALKIFGALFVCLAGHPILRAAENLNASTLQLSHPMDYIFSEEGMGNIIIECKDGSELIVPFSDIIDALKPNNPIQPTETTGG